MNEVEQYIKNLEGIINKISKYYEAKFKNNYVTNNAFLDIRKNENLSTSEHMTMVFN